MGEEMYSPRQEFFMATFLRLLYLPRLAFAVSFICYSPQPAFLPRLPDCEDLISAIGIIAQLPWESEPKIWGRHVPDVSTLTFIAIFNSFVTVGRTV